MRVFFRVLFFVNIKSSGEEVRRMCGSFELEKVK
jgi:hypothetical protein